jgi:pimeloyl-ACP methyl ester carboxylesterase
LTPPSLPNATFVLLHGAFHGGWCWRAVTQPLRARGHTVFTPTLTGLGERRHLLSNDVDVGLWVADLVGVIEAEELQDVILVGHSFAGLLISGVADRLATRLRRLVYLDASIAVSGTPMRDDILPDIWAARMAAAFDVGGVRCVASPKASFFGVTDPALAEWVERRLTPMPVRAYETAIDLAHPVGNGVPATYIECTAPRFPVATRSVALARALGWPVLEFPAAHDAMVTAPEELARVLAGLADG